MELTNAQRLTVVAWVSDGLSLAEIQANLEKEYEIALTYMETRFLLDDLELSLKDRPITATPDLSKPPVSSTAGAGSPGSLGLDPSGAGSGLRAGEVSIEIDKIPNPGVMVSGSVTFPDGVSSKWGIDQFGRITMDPSQPGYEPAPADLTAFQNKLQMELQRQGF